MRVVSFFSGGIMSWRATKRHVDRHGTAGLTMLFTDTLIEDADLYRFLIEASANVVGRVIDWQVPRAEDFPETYLLDGERPRINPEWIAFITDLRERAMMAIPELVWIADGRTPWDVFNDEKILGNTRIDPCSKILKRQIGLKWLVDNCAPADTTLIFGIHFEESHRLEGEVWSAKPKKKVVRGVRPRYRDLGWLRVEAPMCDSPLLTPGDILSDLKATGIARPRLYAWGFSHNNCGGFCIKAGEGHFVNLYEKLPARYAAHEGQEVAFNENRPGKVWQTILAPERMVDGKKTRVPMTLTELREKITAKDTGQVSLFDVGGCGCFLDEPEEDEAA